VCFDPFCFKHDQHHLFYRMAFSLTAAVTGCYNEVGRQGPVLISSIVCSCHEDHAA